MQQLLLEPCPGTHKRVAAGWDSRGRGWRGQRVGPTTTTTTTIALFQHFQVLGASEQPSQFSLTNAAGSHITSEGISSPAPGELLFSSFHNLLSGPYFWSLPASFRGDMVGGSEEHDRQGIKRIIRTWPDLTSPTENLCPPRLR